MQNIHDNVDPTEPLSDSSLSKLRELCSPDVAARFIAIRNLLDNPMHAREWTGELWALACAREAPIRDVAVEVLGGLLCMDPSVHSSFLARFEHESPEMRVAAVRVFVRAPEFCDDTVLSKMERLLAGAASSDGHGRGYVHEALRALGRLPVDETECLEPSSLASNTGAHKVVGKAVDLALYFRPLAGPAREQGLLLWVMCPTIGMDIEQRNKHVIESAKRVIDAVGESRIEYLGRGTVGFKIDEGYFQRGLTWKDIVFAPKGLQGAYKTAYGTQLEVAEVQEKLVQIGTFAENKVAFSAVAGPAMNQVNVDIHRLLEKGRPDLSS